MDARAPTVAELARRLLRTDSLQLEVPMFLEESAIDLSLHVSDSLPSLLREPKVVSDSGWNYLSLKTEVLIGRIGGPEPEIEVCWIPCDDSEVRQIWEMIVDSVKELLVAGYPGCIGCAGPAATEPWDESGSRARLNLG